MTSDRESSISYKHMYDEVVEAKDKIYDALSAISAIIAKETIGNLVIETEEHGLENALGIDDIIKEVVDKKIIEQINILSESIKQNNAKLEQMRKEIRALKHEDEELPFKALDPDAKLPVRKHATDAGMDVHCIKDYDIASGERVIVQTGLAVAMPEDSVLYICPRSGLAANNGLTIVNTPATIDAGFRGELKVIMLNTGSEPVHFDKGDRVAQLELLTCRFPKPVFADELPEPSDGRGATGYGSTGVK